MWKKRLQHLRDIIGIGLDIRDLADVIRWAFLALGGAGLVAGVLRAITQLPPESWALISFGTFFVLLPFFPAAIRSIARRVMTATTRELLEFYHMQERSWRSFIDLELTNVDCSHVNEASPYAVLTLVIRNFLPIPLKLIRVIEGKGTVDRHTLPPLPENYNVTVKPCSQNTFDVNLQLYGQMPDHLRHEASADCPRALRWVFRGLWQVEVFGQIQDAWYPRKELLWQGIPNVPGDRPKASIGI